MGGPEFLGAAAACGIHTSYYALCDSHPLRPSLPSISTSAKDVLAAVAGQVALEKLRGPGSVYRLLSLPDGFALNVVIQQRTTVETHFNFSSGETMRASTFAILCKEIPEGRGGPWPEPNGQTESKSYA